jgi:chromosome segregation ATPase
MEIVAIINEEKEIQDRIMHLEDAIEQREFELNGLKNDLEFYKSKLDQARTILSRYLNEH